MTALARQICLNHPHREAVARCVECARFFCRECIADHEGRLICASCLHKLAGAAVQVARTWPGAVRAVAKSLVGFTLAWLCFYNAGRALVQLPSTFHEDLWNATWSKIQRALQDD
jgi:hypothetical protein